MDNEKNYYKNNVKFLSLTNKLQGKIEKLKK